MSLYPDNIPYILNPSIQRTFNGQRLVIESPFYNLRIQSKKDLSLVLDQFLSPQVLVNAEERLGIDPNLLNELVRHYLIIPASCEEFLSKGLIVQAPNPVGHHHDIWKVENLLQSSHIALLGCPTDLGGEFGGAREGPRLIRDSLNAMSSAFILGSSLSNASPVIDYELERRYHDLPSRLVDFGNIRYNLGESLDAVGCRLGCAIHTLSAHDMSFVLLGGDHSLSYYSIKSVSESVESLGVIHFDAHHDFYRNELSQVKRLDHGNVMSWIMDLPRVERIMQIGLRTIEDYLPEQYTSMDTLVSFQSSYRTIKSTPNAALQSLPKEIPYYLTFDLDCMDLLNPCETGTPVCGGLTYYVALEYLDYIFRTFRVIGIDFMELRSADSRINHSSQHIARYIASYLLSGIEFSSIM